MNDVKDSPVRNCNKSVIYYFNFFLQCMVVVTSGICREHGSTKDSFQAVRINRKLANQFRHL